eukprot:TRINITY_DN1744_c0_g1_i10.p1 TRINITY_DN1744_c0_g1~~TRINITY_DN1744_c0_g1_i10.p1  ORF type:complete len:166 (-),score=62.36 TRINITY_DN1744_c0_g1_i10:154-651(-)
MGSKSLEKSAKPEVDYFMWQNADLDNACGLIACLHAVFNNRRKVGIEEKSPLSELWELAKGLSPEERANALNGFTKIQDAHKECSSEGQSEQAEESSQVRYHFICFTRNHKGELVELDGMLVDPRLLDKCTEEELVQKVADEIGRRLKAGIITDKMALMALCRKQ